MPVRDFLMDVDSCCIFSIYISHIKSLKLSTCDKKNVYKSGTVIIVFSIILESVLQHYGSSYSYVYSVSRILNFVTSKELDLLCLCK